MKGYALLVGVNTLDQAHYEGDRYFADAFDDIPVISDILKDAGVFYPENTHILIDLEHKPNDGISRPSIHALTKNPVLKPTADNFLKIIKEQYIEKTDPEETFLVIFFSGHGTYIELENQNQENEEFEKRQLLCFQDRMLLENEMRESLIRIPENFKVLFVVNACYSAGLSQKRFNIINWQHILNIPLEELEGESMLKENGLLGQIKQLGTRLFANKNLQPNKYVIDYLERSWAIEQTLRKHGNYKDKVDEFPEDYMNYKTDFCYLFSCGKDEVTEIGWLDSPSYFTRLLKKTWNKSKQEDMTYRQFERKLKADARKDIQPSLYTFPTDKSTIFDTASPFYYERRPGLNNSNNSLFKTQTMATFELKPFPTATPTYVEIDITSGDHFFVNMGLSTTYNLKTASSNRLTEILARLTGDITPDIQYLGVIDVTETDPGTTFPIKVPKMEIDKWPVDDDTEDGNGFIVLYDSENKVIKGKKRTNGKVTNSQG